MNWERWLELTLENFHWAGQAFLVIFVSLVADWIQRIILTRIHRRLEIRTRTPWDDALVDAIRRPLSALIWILGITFAAEIIQGATGATIFEAIDPLRSLGVVTVLAWFLLRLVRNAQDAYLKSTESSEGGLDPITLNSLTKLVRVSILITAALVALQTLGFSISGVLAFGGIGGIAVGFAAKDLLANFFGGLMIYMDRPFAVGDWVRSPDKDIEGTVEDIGWRLTRIRRFNKRPVYVPNAVFSTIALENPSRMTHRRIYETIGIRYGDGDKMAGIVAGVKEMLQSHEDIDATQTLMVNFNAFAASSLDFFLYTFTKTREWTEFHRVKEDVLLKVMEIIANHGAEIAFPTSTLHLPGGVEVLRGEGK